MMRHFWLVVLAALLLAPAPAQAQALGQDKIGAWAPAAAAGATADPLSLANITGTTSNCGGAAADAANSVCLSSNAITGEGATADAFETILAWGNATADQTLTCTGAASSLGCVVAAPATAASSTAGNALALTASAATAGDTNAGAAAGGSVTITAGNAARLTSGNARGGGITLATGSPIGAESPGSTTVTGGPLVVTGVIGVSTPSANAIALSTSGITGEGPTSDVWETTLAFGDCVGPSTDCSFTIGANSGSMVTLLGIGPSIETVATTKAPTAAESNELYTNGSDVDGQAITLLNDPPLGTCYEFALTSTDSSGSFAIAAAAGETLMDAATTCSTSFSATAKGATARICAVSGGSGGLWLVMFKNGAWTCS